MHNSNRIFKIRFLLLLKCLFAVFPFIILIAISSIFPRQNNFSENYSILTEQFITKQPVFIIILVLMGFALGIFPIINKIDPTFKIKATNQLFYSLELIVLGFLSLFSVLLIYFAYKEIVNPNYLICLLGLFFLMLGLHYKYLPQNYFIGIRTPWTLVNNEVWKNTHRLAGKIWQLIGPAIVLSSLFFNGRFLFILFLMLVFFMVLIPIVYSYTNFKALNKAHD